MGLVYSLKEHVKVVHSPQHLLCRSGALNHPNKSILLIESGLEPLGGTRSQNADSPVYANQLRALSGALNHPNKSILLIESIALWGHTPLGGPRGHILLRFTTRGGPRGPRRSRSGAQGDTSLSVSQTGRAHADSCECAYLVLSIPRDTIPLCNYIRI